MQINSGKGTFTLGASVVRTFGSHRDSVLRVWFSDDAGRLPVQIETAVPILGTGILLTGSAQATGCRSTSGPAITRRSATS